MNKREILGIGAPLQCLEPAFEEKVCAAKKLGLQFEGSFKLVLCVCKESGTCKFKKRSYVEERFGDILPNVEDTRNFFVECADSCAFCGVLSEKDYVANVVFY